MLDKALQTIITIVVSGALGYCVNYIKNFKHKEKAQNEALKNLLQNSLTNIYFVYGEIGEIPDYALKNWVNLLSSYEALDGDDYVHELDVRIRKMKVKITGIVK